MRTCLCVEGELHEGSSAIIQTTLAGASVLNMVQIRNRIQTCVVLQNGSGL